MANDERDARSLSQDAKEALRVRGVELWLGGMTQAQIGRVLGVHERQVRRWLKRYRHGGWEGLEKQKRGRSSESQMILSCAQQMVIVKLIKCATPDQLRLPGLLWTRGQVGDLIDRQFGVRLARSTVGNYLRRWGFTLKHPTKRALEADPEVVEGWLGEVYPAIKAKAAKEGGVILWQDESGIRLCELTPKAGYAPKGERAIVTTCGKRVGVNMISAIGNGGQLHFRIFEGNFDSDLFLSFLERLTGEHHGRKVFLICDNHSAHHAANVRAWAAEHTNEIELHFLPTYSPELNPDEMLNQDVKRHMREVFPRPTDLLELVDTISAFLLGRQRDPGLVARYFLAPTVTYAR